MGSSRKRAKSITSTPLKPSAPLPVGITFDPRGSAIRPYYARVKVKGREHSGRYPTVSEAIAALGTFKDRHRRVGKQPRAVVAANTHQHDTGLAEAAAALRNLTVAPVGGRLEKSRRRRSGTATGAARGGGGLEVHPECARAAREAVALQGLLSGAGVDQTAVAPCPLMRAFAWELIDVEGPAPGSEQQRGSEAPPGAHPPTSKPDSHDLFSLASAGPDHQ